MGGSPDGPGIDPGTPLGLGSEHMIKYPQEIQPPLQYSEIIESEDVGVSGPLIIHQFSARICSHIHWNMLCICGGRVWSTFVV